MTSADRGEELKLAWGGRIIWACARKARAKIFPLPQLFFPTLDMIFAPLWAYFFKFSLYIVRMAKSSGGELLPPEELS